MGIVYDLSIGLLNTKEEFEKIVGKKCIGAKVKDDALEQKFFFENGLVLEFSAQEKETVGGGSSRGFLEIRKAFDEELKELEK